MYCDCIFYLKLSLSISYSTIKLSISGDWNEYRISLSCFEKLGIDMTKITSVLTIKGSKGVDIGLGNVRLESEIDAKPGCNVN